jgi:hypothetical protein
MTRFKRLNEWILLAVIAILATLWLQAPRLLDPLQVDQDFRTFYWMNKFQDSALFSNVSNYIPVNFLGVELPFMILSPGYGFLFYLASFFITPVFFSKILVFFVLPITVLYLFEFGRMAHSRDIGISLAVVFMLLNLASPSSSSIIPGLQRSFAGSLIIVLIYYLHTQRYVGAAITIFVSVLIYPPMFAFGGVIWVLYITKIAFKPYPKLSIHYQGVWELVVAALLGCLVMVPLMLPRISVLISREEVEALNNQTTETTSETVETDSESYKYMWDNPIYRSGGQEPLFFWFPWPGPP